jgi:Poxvirus A32 protein
MDVESFADMIEVPFRMSVASKSNSGKTHLVSELTKQLLAGDKVYMVFVQSNTHGVNNDYSFLPAKCRGRFDPKKLDELFQHQAKTPREQRKQVLVILDDVLGDRSAENNEAIMSFYARGRHANISVILNSQVANRVLSPAVKENSCYILYSRLNRQQLSILWETITNMDKAEFIKFSEHVNKNYNFVVIDNTSHSNDPHEFLKVVRA